MSYGPYADEDARLKAAQAAWAGEGDFDFSQETDDIERLDVDKKGKREVSPFSNGELEE
jgi:hypothetical protein